MSAFGVMCGKCCRPMRLKRKNVVVASCRVLRHADEFHCPVCGADAIAYPAKNPHRDMLFDPEGYEQAYKDEQAMGNLKVMRKDYD